MRASGDPAGSRGEVWAFTVEGTWGAEFVPELTPAPDDLVVSKFRSSAFHETNLDLVLRSNGIKTVLVCGCTTEGCVESTVRDAGFHDYLAVVISDCVGSDVPELHSASMFVMSSYRADVIDSADAARMVRDSRREDASGTPVTAKASP
jgi:nicotinamidase-related amidase